MTDNCKRQVIELLKSIETGDARPIAYFNPGTYIRHNLTGTSEVSPLQSPSS